MKYVLINPGNEGLLYCGENLMLVNYLKMAFEGINMMPLADFDPLAKKIDYKFIQANNWFFSKGNFGPLPEEQVTPTFLERKAQCKVRARGLYMLIEVCRKALARTYTFSHYDFHTMISRELDKCVLTEPASYTEAIKEYAAIHEIDLQTAYQELKLQVDEALMIKVRVHAYLEKYARLMNKVNSDAEADAVYLEMYTHFYYHSTI
jgi:hypothetical protein